MPKTDNGIHYEEWGNGPDAIVLLPGLGCSLKCWSEVAPLLDGYRLVLMDLPGHAGSLHAPADGSSLARIADTVIDACDQLGLERFALVGLSFGGALSVRIALNRPGQVVAVMALMPWNAGGTEAGDPVIEGFHKSFRDVEAITQAIGAISLEPSKTTDVVRTMTSAVTEQFWRSWLGTGGGAYTSMFEELSGIAVAGVLRHRRPRHHRPAGQVDRRRPCDARRPAGLPVGRGTSRPLRVSRACRPGDPRVRQPIREHAVAGRGFRARILAQRTAEQIETPLSSSALRFLARQLGVHAAADRQPLAVPDAGTAGPPCPRPSTLR